MLNVIIPIVVILNIAIESGIMLSVVVLNVVMPSVVAPCFCPNQHFFARKMKIKTKTKF
jgi:hypothetical protein